MAEDPQGELEHWLFTVVRHTGEVIKIEKINLATGERAELCEREYAAVARKEYSAFSAADGAAAVPERGARVE
jgi:hypothetical protein